MLETFFTYWWVAVYILGFILAAILIFKGLKMWGIIQREEKDGRG